MLDSKQAAILKQVTELSKKFDTMLERLGSVKQQVYNLGDTSMVNAPQLESDHTQKGSEAGVLRTKADGQM